MKRCMECFNLEPFCRCHPSVARPTVAGVTPEERDRLLAAYAARGVDQLEALVNGDG